MPEDCLAMLLDLYQDYQRKSRLVDLLEDEKIHRSFSRLLRQVIPWQSLLRQTLNPYDMADKLYLGFSVNNPRSGSLKYLSLYESITAGLNQLQSI